LIGRNPLPAVVTVPHPLAANPINMSFGLLVESVHDGVDDEPLAEQPADGFGSKIVTWSAPLTPKTMQLLLAFEPKLHVTVSEVKSVGAWA
jgi:hypothetical protein